MRTWKSPFNGERICLVAGTSISTQRVPNHSMGLVEDKRELHKYLLSPASSHGFASTEEYQKTLALVRKILDMLHQLAFTHGDFKAHNILVDVEGHFSGFFDWECVQDSALSIGNCDFNEVWKEQLVVSGGVIGRRLAFNGTRV